jgi:hypothetical protein
VPRGCGVGVGPLAAALEEKRNESGTGRKNSGGESSGMSARVAPGMAVGAGLGFKAGTGEQAKHGRQHRCNRPLRLLRAQHSRNLGVPI